MFSTKTTWLGSEYGCRVFAAGVLVLEGRAKTRAEIGPVFRDLLRSLDKLGGDEFTSAARHRKHKDQNMVISVKHIWPRKGGE